MAWYISDLDPLHKAMLFDYVISDTNSQRGYIVIPRYVHAVVAASVNMMIR